MRRIFQLSVWQLRLLAKYQVLTVAFIIGAFYVLAFILFPEIKNDEVVSFLIFSDPSMLGFTFVGAMILFEKNDRTLSAQIITPLRPVEYLAGKSIALLVPALICSFLMVFAGRGMEFRLLPFLITTMITSLIFTLLGIAGAVRVDTFNQYIIVIPGFLLPFSLPLLNFFGLTDWKILYLIPSQASLYLFSQSFSETANRWELIAYAYLLAWLILAGFIAKRSFENKMYQ